MAKEEYTSAQCKYYQICGRDVEGNPADGVCILHSTDSAKDADAFAEALAAHREHKGDNFVSLLFPGKAAFYKATFSGEADFAGATFSGEAYFGEAAFSERAIFGSARFSGRAVFTGATFSGGAAFSRARFSGDVDFTHAVFSERAAFAGARFSWRADFAGATFSGEAYFVGVGFRGEADFNVVTFGEGADFGSAEFSGEADFAGATFSKGADFGEATFSGGADFGRATFLGRTLFAGRPGSAQAGHIFAGMEVDFRQVVINPPDVISFLGADLTTCLFLDTDLRKAQLVDVKWPQKGGRVLVYDEMASTESEDEAGNARPWSRIERLYRELKQNYEDRRDYERAGDFHYGEKEMRRKNPGTALGLRFFLTLYRLFSGYGERYLRPLLWAGLLFVGSTIGYMRWGLRLKDGSSSLVWSYPWVNSWDWLQAAYYSFRVMTFFKPDDWVPVRYAQVVNTFQTLLSPLFLGFFALALRQRLKR
jgi:uncharacterized protein YjbI with pentapeptide repeats